MIQKLAAFLALGTIGACASQSLGPSNWQPIAGEANAWSSGSGSRLQEYRLNTAPFSGTLQDLASQVTIETLTRHRGAKFDGSEPFRPCPGAAGVATFRLPAARRLEAAFSVEGGRAVRVAYVRPLGAATDPAAGDAMRRALCAL